MAPLGPILAFLVLFASSEAQQAGRASAGGARVLQPWLVGLTAVVVFLFIVFVLMIINRLWCKKERSQEEPNALRMEENAYTNLGLVPDVEQTFEGQRKARSGSDVEIQSKAPASTKWQKEDTTEAEKITSM